MGKVSELCVCVCVCVRVCVRARARVGGGGENPREPRDFLSHLGIDLSQLCGVNSVVSIYCRVFNVGIRVHPAMKKSRGLMHIMRHFGIMWEG